jgi:hypothetical protein
VELQQCLLLLQLSPLPPNYYKQRLGQALSCLYMALVQWLKPTVEPPARPVNAEVVWFKDVAGLSTQRAGLSAH